MLYWKYQLHASLPKSKFNKWHDSNLEVSIYTRKINKHYSSWLFLHSSAQCCALSVFKTSPILPIVPPVWLLLVDEGIQKRYHKLNHNYLFLRRQSISFVCSLSCDHYCIVINEVILPMGIWLFITSESFYSAVVLQAFIQSRQPLIGIWKTVWTLNGKQMRRPKENRTFENHVFSHEICMYEIFNWCWLF